MYLCSLNSMVEYYQEDRTCNFRAVWLSKNTPFIFRSDHWWGNFEELKNREIRQEVVPVRYVTKHCNVGLCSGVTSSWSWTRACLLAAGSDLRVAADVKIHRCEIIELVQSTTKSLLAVPFHVAISDFHHQTRDASF